MIGEGLLGRDVVGTHDSCSLPDSIFEVCRYERELDLVPLLFSDSGMEMLHVLLS